MALKDNEEAELLLVGLMKRKVGKRRKNMDFLGVTNGMADWLGEQKEQN